MITQISNLKHMKSIQISPICCQLNGSKLKIQKELARGTHGIIYLTDTNHAIKLANWDDSVDILQTSRSINNEIKILSKLNHPNIVTYLGGLEKETGFAMEYVPNERSSLNSASDLIKVLKAMASALSYLHSLGILHQDIKTENILIQKDFSKSKLCDFGSANSETFGTYRFYPPELIEKNEFDERSEIYCLGIALLRLATTRFDEEFNRIGLDIHFLQKGYLMKGFDSNLFELINKMTQPKKRYGSMKEILDILD